MLPILPKRIVFTGPESTGKSQLSEKLALKLKAHHVPEFAREYLAGRERKRSLSDHQAGLQGITSFVPHHTSYGIEDLKNIEEGQKFLENQAYRSDNQIVIQDTDFLTIWIWYGYKYGQSPKRVIDYLSDHLPDLYLLCYPDLPWTPDPQRENPKDRMTLFDCHLLEIEDLDVPYAVIKGYGDRRVQNVLDALEKNGLHDFKS